MQHKTIKALQEKFTENRVDLLIKLTEYVLGQVVGAREAVETFAKINLMNPVEARKYMYLMTNSELRHIWNFKL